MLSNQQHKLCAYRNEAKSKPYFDVDGKIVNQAGFDFCEFEGTWVQPGIGCTAGDDIKDLVEVFCVNCGKKLCQYKVLPKKTATDLYSILDFRYTEQLAAYRPRPDGVLGLECLCGYSDTRLSNEEKEREPEKYPAIIRTTSKEEATAGHKKCDFSYNKRVASSYIPDRKKHGKIELPVRGAKP